MSDHMSASDEARAALQSLETARAAGAQHSAIPRWFAGLTAGVVAVHVAAQSILAPYLEIAILVSGIGLFLIYALWRWRSGVRVQAGGAGTLAAIACGVAGVIGGVALYLAAGVVSMQTGTELAALPMAVAAAMLTYGAFEWARGAQVWSARRTVR